MDYLSNDERKFMKKHYITIIKNIDVLLDYDKLSYEALKEIATTIMKNTPNSK